MTTAIRPATPGDVATILGFVRELAAFEREPDAVAATEPMLAEALFGAHRAAEAVIAERDGVAVGFALFFRNFYVSVPDALIRAARLDGAGFFTIFARILLPMSIPTIMVCLIWQFTQIWNDFLFGVVFASGDTQPITVALNNLVNTSTGVKEYNVDMAAAMIAGLPTLLVYILAGKYFLRGLTAGAVKG